MSQQPGIGIFSKEWAPSPESLVMLPSSGLMTRVSPQKFSGLYLASLALAEQVELVVWAHSTLGALVAGIVRVDESKQAELLINIL